LGDQFSAKGNTDQLDCLKNIFRKHNFSPNRIFNMDESGSSAIPSKLPKVTAEKSKILVGKIESAARGQLVTVVCCFNASFICVPLAVIFPS
jgi:hypothetical protein